MLGDCCSGTVGLISSPSVVSSCFGERAAVILRSRAASSDLRTFSSSSLPHVRDTMASRVGTSTRFFSARSRCCLENPSRNAPLGFPPGKRRSRPPAFGGGATTER